MLPTNFVFLDTETTGLNPRRDRIIEIGLIRVENNKEVGRFQTLLNPHTYVSPFITDITGIVGQNLENAPEFEDIAKELHEYLENAILVAHNARFDYGFLKYEFLRIGQKYTSKSLCTAKLSRILFPKYRRHNLDSIIERFNISVANRHRAFDDAMAIWEFYTKLQRDSNEKKLHDAVQFLLKHPSLPMHLRSKEIDTVSNGPGVYLFYGDNDTPLYIGKSVTVKDRIKSHFGSDHSNSREMSLSSQVKRIEVLPTSGELGALLKEAELIKKLQPVYNRKLRQARRLIIIKEIEKQGYTQAAIEELTEILPDETHSIITTSKSKKQAQEYLHFLSEEYGLCKKLLGLEKGKGACFAYRLEKCKGACIGKENPLAYNARCIIAFSQQKIKRWPFSGPVIFYEENEFTNSKDEFLVDKWCLLGKRSRVDDLQNDFETKDYRFDMDTYKILLQFVKNHAKNKKFGIIPLENNKLQNI